MLSLVLLYVNGRRLVYHHIKFKRKVRINTVKQFDFREKYTSPGYSPLKKSLVARARQVGRHQHLLKWDHSTATSPALQSSPAQAREVRPPVGWEVCWAVKHTLHGQPRSASWADRPSQQENKGWRP